MYKFLVIILFTLFSQANHACDANKLYAKYEPITDAYYTNQLIKHINGDLKAVKGRRGKTLLIQSGLHSDFGLTEYLKQAPHTNHAQAALGRLKTNLHYELENMIQIAFLPEGAFFNKSIAKFKERLKKPEKNNFFLSKKLKNQEFYSLVLFPEYMSPTDIAEASLEILSSTDSYIVNSFSSHTTNIRGTYRPSNNQPPFEMLVSISKKDHKIITSYPILNKDLIKDLY